MQQALHSTLQLVGIQFNKVSVEMLVAVKTKYRLLLRRQCDHISPILDFIQGLSVLLRLFTSTSVSLGQLANTITVDHHKQNEAIHCLCPLSLCFISVYNLN